MDKEREELERLAYAHMLMEHFYAIEQELSKFKSINGIRKFEAFFPFWNEFSDGFKQSVYKLVKPVDPVLADVWDRSVYANIKVEDVVYE